MENRKEAKITRKYRPAQNKIPLKSTSKKDILLKNPAQQKVRQAQREHKEKKKAIRENRKNNKLNRKNVQQKKQINKKRRVNLKQTNPEKVTSKIAINKISSINKPLVRRPRDESPKKVIF